MDPNQEMLSELKKLNQKLDKVSNDNRFFVFNTNPFKFAIYNFLGGTFHSLGTIFGTLIIATAIIYLVSRINFTKPIVTWIENTLSQIRWEKVIQPTDTIKIKQNSITPTPTSN